MSSIRPRAAILSLIQGEEGRSWAASRVGWDETSKEPYCDWDGIVCDPVEEEILSIHLPGSDLFARLPSELGVLSSLRVLDMRHNLLTGTIPVEIVSLPNLEQVLFANNRLEGALRPFRSVALQNLDLSRNLLHGQLPTDFCANNAALTNLDLQQNDITGQISNELMTLELLESLSLTSNRITGTLPASLGSMPSLRNIYLSDNSLMGTLPGEWAHPENGGNFTSQLTEIWLHNNMISGTIAESFGLFPNLVDFFVDGNKLTGRVPMAVCALKLNADFSDTNKVGSDESDLLCDAVSCPIGTFSDEGVHPCSRCQSTLHQPYIGRTGCQDMTESTIVRTLFSSQDPSPSTLTNSPCEISGISCNADGLIKSIDLSNEGLSGTIPDELGFLAHLEELDLSDNAFTGFLPSGLRFAPLKRLNLSGTRLRGIVPPLLCETLSVNNNGNSGVYSCDNIACPMGTYSETGYGICIPCTQGGDFLAGKACMISSTDGRPYGDSPSSSDNRRSVMTYVMLSLFALAAMALIAIAVMRWRRSRQRPMLSLQTQWIDQGDSEHLPHVEELKSRLRALRGVPSRRSWLSQRLGRSMNLVINLGEHRGGSDRELDVASRANDAGAPYHDDVSLDSRLSQSSDLERVVHEQARNVVVWSYPDPLERVPSTSSSASKFHDEEVSSSDEDEVDAI